MSNLPVKFSEALHAAQDTTDPEAFIQRVKQTVAAELQELDPSATIRDTGYFNHSSIPDLVVDWRRDKDQREVFLRHSYESVKAAEDTFYLQKRDPMLLTLSAEEASRVQPEPTEPPDVSEVLEELMVSTLPDQFVAPIAWTERSADPSSRLLLTDPLAVDVIRSGEDGTTPIAHLVRANFLRGAKGHIDQPKAEELVQFDSPAAGITPSSNLIHDTFREDAAYRINRTAKLLELATQEGAFSDEDLASIGGRLSLPELSHLVPWLLQHGSVAPDSDFWRFLGEMMTFEDLESIREALEGIDVTPLIHANAHRWSAKRAYIGLATPHDDAPDESIRSYWAFERGAVGIDLGEHRLMLAHLGTMLKGRENESSVKWNDLSPSLSNHRLSKVDLRGIRRSVIINAEQTPDVRADVEEVTTSLDDDYFVNDVTLRFSAPGEREGFVEVDVQFGKALAVATPDASLHDLARSAVEVLMYREGETKPTLAAVLPPKPQLPATQAD